MTNFAINEDRTAEATLEVVWARLAVRIEMATAFKRRQAAQDPTLDTEPEVEPYVRWLDTFSQELAQIQTIRDGASAVSAEELRTASEVGQQLLGAIDQVVERQAAAAAEPAPADEVVQADPAPAAQAQDASSEPGQDAPAEQASDQARA